MTKMSNLPRDLAEEVLSKVPLTSLRNVRSTCKKWKTLCKSRSFAKKHFGQASVAAAKAVMMMDCRLYLMGIDFDKNVKLITGVFHCDGLLLCITKDNPRLVVWNPYTGQTRCIEPTHNFHRSENYSYAFGYDKSSNSCSRRHKFLRFATYHRPSFAEYFELYDFNSDSWRIIDPPRGWKVEFYDRGLSLKGNTYWFARMKPSETSDGDNSFLVCFDFTGERFGPPLPVPFKWWDEHTLSLSSVREEQLAVLYQRWNTLDMEIWVTTKIEPDAVSWNTKVFLEVDLRPLTSFRFRFVITSFFIDEEKKVAVVFGKTKERLVNRSRNVAYIVGVDGSLREADLGDSTDENCYPIVCSYVPTSKSTL